MQNQSISDLYNEQMDREILALSQKVEQEGALNGKAIAETFRNLGELILRHPPLDEHAFDVDVFVKEAFQNFDQIYPELYKLLLRESVSRSINASIEKLLPIQPKEVEEAGVSLPIDNDASFEDQLALETRQLVDLGRLNGGIIQERDFSSALLRLSNTALLQFSPKPPIPINDFTSVAVEYFKRNYGLLDEDYLQNMLGESIHHAARSFYVRELSDSSLFGSNPTGEQAEDEYLTARPDDPNEL